MVKSVFLPRRGLTALRQIKPFTKKSKVVIIDVKKCVKEAEQQFNNKEAFKKLQCDPTQTRTRRLVNDTITCFKNDKLIRVHLKGLIVQQPKTPKF